MEVEYLDKTRENVFSILLNPEVDKEEEDKNEEKKEEEKKRKWKER